MPDFAPNFTGRVKLRYSTLDREHTMMWRFPAAGTAVTAAEIVTKMHNFLVAIEASLYADWSVLGADYALANSDVFLPLASPVGPTGAATVPTNAKSEGALSACWLGRSIAGHRARFFLYGTVFNLEGGPPGAEVDDFRLTSSESTAVLAGYTALAGGPGTQVANDDNPISWYGYVDLKYNDYWVRRSRG